MRDLLGSQGLGVLATSGEGGPHTSLVAFSVTKDLSTITFATTRASRKYENILYDPRVSMLIDDRGNDVSDFKDAVAVSASGEAREPDGEEWETLMSGFTRKHPYLEEFARKPTVALIVIDVRSYNLVSRFQSVVEMSPNE